MGLERREDRGLPGLTAGVCLAVAPPVEAAAFEPGIDLTLGDGVFDEVLTLAFG